MESGTEFCLTYLHVEIVNIKKKQYKNENLLLHQVVEK